MATVVGATSLEVDRDLHSKMKDKAKEMGVPVKVLTNALVGGLVDGHIHVVIQAKSPQSIVLHYEAIAS